MAGLNFNATQVAPSTGAPELIKDVGWYQMAVTESEVKPTKDGSGLRLNLTFTILGGKYNGRKVFEGLNIRNSNPTAQQIAEADLSAICHAVDVLDLQDSQQLHNRPLKGKLKIRPAQGEYEAKNELAGYRHLNDASAQLCETAVGAGGDAGGAPGMAAMQMPNMGMQQQPQAMAPQNFQQPQAMQQQQMMQQQAPVNYNQQPQQQMIPQNVPQQQQPEWMQSAAPQQPWQQPQAAQQLAAAPVQQQQAAQGAMPQGAQAAQGAMPPWAIPQQ